jgi:hypothetical protein
VAKKRDGWDFSRWKGARIKQIEIRDGEATLSVAKRTSQIAKFYLT